MKVFHHLKFMTTAIHKQAFSTAEQAMILEKTTSTVKKTISMSFSLTKPKEIQRRSNSEPGQRVHPILTIMSLLGTEETHRQPSITIMEL